MNLSKKTVYLPFIITAYLLLFFLFPSSVFAVAQLTKPIEIRNALRGQEIVETMKVFNTEGKETAYGLSAKGDIENWAVFYETNDRDFKQPITKVLVPAKSYIDVLVKFIVPKNTPNGSYSGEVVVSMMPNVNTPKESGTVAVFQEIGREVFISVTDKEIIKVYTTVIPEKYDMKAGEDLRIKVSYENLGNVAIKPDLQLKILRGGRVVFNAIFPYPEDKEAIKPLETQTMPIFEWQTDGQRNDKYKAEIKVLVGGNVADEKSFRFNIVNPALSQQSSSGNKLLAAIASLGGGNLRAGLAIIGACLAVLAFTIFFLFGKAGRKLFYTIGR